ncbi:MAG: acyl-CoA dehydrogenase family protein, partial [Pseudomonadota bacterium]
MPDTLHALDSEADDIVERTRAFVEEVCIPEEPSQRARNHWPTDDLRLDLVGKARDAGIYGPHLPVELGGLGLPWVDRAKIFQAVGYSMLGPMALHCSAPDEGNHHLLHMVASGAQKEQFLVPLVQDAKRSCFMMSEPDGAGADPTQMTATAVRDGNDYLVSGRKWYITGAIGAEVAIIMARDGDAEDARPTMFLTPMSAPGIEIVRDMDGIAHESPGGHCEVNLDNVRVPAENVLGAPGEAFRYAQVRLAPARLTHCMRWLGGAERSHDVARRYGVSRKAFGKPLVAHQAVGSMLADNEIDIRTSELMIADCARLLDAGEHARHETSLAKVFVSEAVWRTVDRCVQILGGIGVMADTPVEAIFRAARAFRIYDGPSETHRDAIARR